MKGRADGPRDSGPGGAARTGGATPAAASVEAACQALEHLERALLAGGYREGAAAYARMAEVILAQRMLGSGRDPALLPLYEHLGEVARRLFGLIHPYESVMRKLAVLAPAHDEAHLSRLVDVLTRRGRRGASVSVLARECALPATDVSAALARLEEAGTVRARTPGTTTPAFVLAAASTPRRGGRPAPRSPGRGAER